MSDINISLDDNSKYSLPEGSTFFDLVQIVPKELSYNVVLAKINNKVFDLSDKLFNSCQVSLLDINSKDGLDALNHSCEHILAAAVCNLIDKTKVVMGPKIHNNNFYYDFDIGRSFTNSDLLNIEDEMKKLISKKLFFEKLLISKKQALMLFHETNQVYKKRILSWINDDVVSIYKSGNFIDLCRGPHLPHTGFIKSFKLLFHSGSYWRNNSNNSMLQRITGIAFSTRKSCKEHLIKLKKIKKNDHRKLGSKLSFFMLSKKFDIHNYASNQNFVLVNIKINDQIQSMRICFEPIFKYNLFEKIEKIISIKIKLNKINFVQLATDNNIFGIELKFFSNIINKIQHNVFQYLSLI